ncbi:MAG: hypothetical protein HEP71_24470 [Roseivirga sp.]|nr:hypothetical protein [Roseivirga sp.]
MKRILIIISVLKLTVMGCSSRDNSQSVSEQFIINTTPGKEIIHEDNWATSELDDSLILKSKSPVISIQDGDNSYKDSWTISPYIELDEYVVEKFKGEKTILFYSDIDTISFSIKPNKNYDFDILLNNGEKAKTRISTDSKKQPSFGKENANTYRNNNLKSTSLSDTIPFKIGKDHRIHIEGKINNSTKLDFIFDTGANTTIIASTIVGNKVNILIDGETMNKGAGGKNKTPISSLNKLEVGHLVWDSVKIVSINYQDPTFDGVIGWTSFKNKILEIDYNNDVIIIHNKSIEIPSDYKKMETKMIIGLPFIKGSVVMNNKEFVGWFEFDTGSNGSFAISQNFDKKHGISNEMEITGTSVASGSSGAKWTINNYLLPKLRLGEFEILRVPVSIRSEDPKGVGYLDILGNNLLKRFNTIIDFKENIIYLKPNDLK